MASPAYEQILSIQALDLAVRQLRHRIDQHPVRQRIAEVQALLGTNATSTGEVEERKHELDRQQKRLEDEVASIEDKRTSIDGKLYGGEVTASKELLALQDEAAGMLDRQRGLEDEQLELMEALDEIASELASLDETTAALQTELAGHQTDLAAEVGEIEAEIAAREAERAEAAAPAKPELLASYESLRSQYDGVPVARLVDGRCDGCHIQLSAVAVDRMGKMPEDAVVTCEECGRLLVR